MILTNMSWFGKSILCESILSSIWNVLVRIGTKSRSINIRLHYHYHDRNEIVNCASLFVCLFVFFWFVWKETFTLRTLYTSTLRATYILHLHYLQQHKITYNSVFAFVFFFGTTTHTIYCILILLVYDIEKKRLHAVQ